MKKGIKLGTSLLLLLLIIAISLYGFVFHKADRTAGYLNTSSTLKKADFHLTTAGLTATFQQDESEACRRYGSSVLSVRGVVKKVDKSDPGNYIITLGNTGALPFGVSCTLDDQYDNVHLALRPGDSITIRGTCAGCLGNIVMVQCIIE